MVDNINQQIIAILTENARTSNVTIGKRIGLSASSVRDRIKKLEDEGVIKNYTIKTDNYKLGYDLEVLIMLKFNTGKLPIFLKNWKTFKEITEVNNITGFYNVALNARLKNQQHLQEFIVNLQFYGEPTTHLILSKKF